MAILTLPGKTEGIEDVAALSILLGGLGIDYELWDLSRVPADSSAEVVLAAYADEIEAMKRRCGFVTADVIDVNAETPGVVAMNEKFNKEHTHSDDEVRFILAGRGIFFLHLADEVYKLEVAAGDMIRVPRNTRHWFTLCSDMRIRAVRWFQDPVGWAPQYTASGIDSTHAPLCFGPAYLGPRVESKITL